MTASEYNGILITICLILIIVIAIRTNAIRRLINRLLPKPDYSIWKKKVDGLMVDHELEIRALKTELAVLNDGEKLQCMGSWCWDMEYDQVHFSKNFASIFRFEKKEIPTAKQLMEVVYIDDVEKVNDAIKNAFETGEPYEIEYRIVRKNGRNDLIRAKGKPVLDDSKKTIQIYGTINLLQENVD